MSYTEAEKRVLKMTVYEVLAYMRKTRRRPPGLARFLKPFGIRTFAQTRGVEAMGSCENMDETIDRMLTHWDAAIKEHRREMYPQTWWLLDGPYIEGTYYE